MRAAVYYENGGPEVFRYEEVPDPPCPAGFVVVDVQAVSVEGGDVLYRWGQPPPHTPYVVGYPAAGVISEVGEGVTDRTLGQRVTTIFPNGSYAEKRAVLASLAFPVPDSLSIEEASTIPIPFGTAEGRGIDVVVDGVGGAVTQASFRVCGYRGRVAMYGNVGRDSYVASRRAFGRVLLLP